MAIGQCKRLPGVAYVVQAVPIMDSPCRLTINIGHSSRLGRQSVAEGSEDRPLQPRSLSSAPLELGTHLYMWALRTVPSYPFVAKSRKLVSKN